MKKLVGFVFIFVIAMNLVSAVSVDYFVVEDKVLVSYDFESVSNLDLRIPLDAEIVEVNVDYSLEDFDNYKIVSIDSGRDVILKFISGSFIDKAGEGFYFISKNYLDEVQDVRVRLPETALLVEDGLFFPEDVEISSDGRSVILNWEDYNEEQIVVNYEFVRDSDLIYYLIIFLLLVILIGSYLFEKVKFNKELKKAKKKSKAKPEKKIKESKKEKLTRNLFEDEKKIIEFLIDKKDNESWTKEMLRELNITKVKLSRKLKSLEKKGLVEKIPFGTENRIRLVKK
jgi:uncharacterized membrane protein